MNFLAFEPEDGSIRTLWHEILRCHIFNLTFCYLAIEGISL